MALYRLAAASGLFAAAAGWPSLVRTLTNLTMTPLERALQTSWCGPPPTETLSFFGHCALCFAGAAVLAAAGLIVLLAEEDAQRRRRRASGISTAFSNIMWRS
jgi:hypothetical protein